MSYLELLEQIEDNKMSVSEVISEIERDTQHQMKNRAKKLKINIKDEGKKILLPAIRFGMIKGVLKVCPPFVRWIMKYMSPKSSIESVNLVIHGMSDALDLMKEYPPIDLISVISKENEIVIYTK